MIKINKKPLTKKKVINIFKSIRITKRNIETVIINKINKRIIAKDIISSVNVPPFNNSAVDGYAIKNSDINLTNFKVVKRILAGDNKKIKLLKGQAVRIFTGAKMPDNAGTVIMQENAIEKNGFVKFLNKTKINENCRYSGEDIKKNQIVFKKNTLIKSSNLGLLASIGLKKIAVYKKLKVGFFTSGNELKNPTKNLSGSKINNSNRYTLNTLISQSGFAATDLGVLKDSSIQVNNSIIKAINNFDIIITAGGASVGDEDHLIKFLKEKGKLVFWKIAIKPGRPLGFGFIKNKPIICLPGNPVSVFLLYTMLIKPFLYKLAGGTLDEPISFPAKINFSMKKKTARMEWLRVKINKKIFNELVVDKCLKQGSGIMTSIAFSDGIIEVPENKSELNAGDIYRFYPLDYYY